MRTNEATNLNKVNRKRLNHLGAAMGLVFLGLTARLLAQEPAAQHYSITTVDVPAALSVDIQYTWLNNSGLISQQYQSPVGAPFPEDLHSAVLEKGVWRVIDRPGQPWTGDTNPNSHGQVLVGNFGDDGPISFSGAVWEHGKYTPLPDPLPGFSYAANGFNDRGQMAGNAFFPDGSVHGFLGNSTAYEIFDYPAEGLVFTIPAMINNAGVVVGEYDVAPMPFGSSTSATRLPLGRWPVIGPPTPPASLAAFLFLASTLIWDCPEPTLCPGVVWKCWTLVIPPTRTGWVPTVRVETLVMWLYLGTMPWSQSQSPTGPRAASG
jgi:hypothetical protein